MVLFLVLDLIFAPSFVHLALSLSLALSVSLGCAPSRANDLGKTERECSHTFGGRLWRTSTRPKHKHTRTHWAFAAFLVRSFVRLLVGWLVHSPPACFGSHTIQKRRKNPQDQKWLGPKADKYTRPLERSGFDRDDDHTQHSSNTEKDNNNNNYYYYYSFHNNVGISEQ